MHKTVVVTTTLSGPRAPYPSPPAALVRALDQTRVSSCLVCSCLTACLSVDGSDMLGIQGSFATDRIANDAYSCSPCGVSRVSLCSGAALRLSAWSPPCAREAVSHVFLETYRFHPQGLRLNPYTLIFATISRVAL